ncbi:MAG: TRAP transporter small permease [Burkholderiales bacterium]
MYALNGLIDKLARALQWLATLMLICIVAINTANVIGRYVFSTPIGWAEEIMLYLLIGAVFLTFVRITHQAAHVRMDMLVRALPSRFRVAMETVADMVTMFVCLTAVYAGAPIVMKFVEFDQRSDSSNIPLAIPQGVLPLGFACAALVLAVGIVERIRHRNTASSENALTGNQRPTP